jgi:prolipoprotein diacylglyceryltransferase
MPLPQTLTFGSTQINLITALVGIALLLSLGAARRHNISWQISLPAHALAAISAVAIGRVVFAAQYWPALSEQPLRIIDLNALPGLSGQGALIGWLLAVCIFWRLQPAYLNALFFGAPLLITVAIAIGCIPNGCLHGRELFWTDAGWPIRVDWPDVYLIQNPRWPTQLMLLAWALGGITALYFVRFASAQAHFFAAALAIAGNLLIQPFRAQTVGVLSVFGVEVWLDVAILCASLALAFFAKPASAPVQSA